MKSLETGVKHLKCVNLTKFCLVSYGHYTLFFNIYYLRLYCIYVYIVINFLIFNLVFTMSKLYNIITCTTQTCMNCLTTLYNKLQYFKKIFNNKNIFCLNY